MRKVIVIGCPGAGKTTFAKKLHEVTGLPLIHLDAVWHRPDRTTIGREAFDAFLRSVMEGNAWILDGNYVRTLPMRLQYSDTVFFLDYSAYICLAGTEERVGRQRDDIPWTEEALNEEFRKKILSFHTDTHPVICSMLEEEQRKGEKDVFVFRSRDKADAFLSFIQDQTTGLKRR